MTMFLVSYSLNPKRDAAGLLAELQRSPKWAHYIDDAWLIVTYESAQQLYVRLVKHFRPSDRLLIVEVSLAIGQYQGWLPKEFWDWINQNRYG